MSTHDDSHIIRPRRHGGNGVDNSAVIRAIIRQSLGRSFGNHLIIRQSTGDRQAVIEPAPAWRRWRLGAPCSGRSSCRTRTAAARAACAHERSPGRAACARRHPVRGTGSRACGWG
eukprot:2783581-Prymnesium_polylepis.1